MRSLFVMTLALAAVACDHPTTPTTPINTDFVLERGDAMFIEDADTHIVFSDVSNDSRCPADVVCVQGGDAHVHIRVTSGVRAREYVLHTGDMKPVTHGDVTIHLVQLAPYPFSSREIESDDYRATFRVTR